MWNYSQSEPSLLTVKDLPDDEQPRQRLLKYGVSSLSNADLFAIILRTGSHNYPITDLCRDLMRMNENLFLNLERKTRDEIREIKGIGELKAMQIEAVMEIVRRYNREKIGDRPRIRSAKDIFELMRHEIGNLPHEEIWVIFLSQTNQVTGKLRVSEGGAVAAVFDIKKVLRNALYAHAQSIILCHNHPSGNLRPSGPDDNITKMCFDACKSIELRMLDHVIVTSEGFYSYQESSSLLS